MLDYDMLASPNYVRFVYDGDGNAEPGNPAGPEGSGKVEQVFDDWFDAQGLASERVPFDGRSDYVGFTDRGIPAGGVFAGAEGVKTAEEEAVYGGAAGSWYDPCYHQLCDNLITVLTGVPPLDAEGLAPEGTTPPRPPRSARWPEGRSRASASSRVPPATPSTTSQRRRTRSAASRRRPRQSQREQAWHGHSHPINH